MTSSQTAPPTPPTDAAPAPGKPSRYPWIAMAVVLIGTYAVVLNMTALNVVLPDIGRDFDSVDQVDWLVTSYLLAVGIIVPATGWLADQIGKKIVFTVSLAVFALASLLAAVAPSMGWLVGFRVLQGLSGGAMLPIGMATVYELFPPDRRGTAMGIWGIAVMAAPATGPVIGGWVATAASWRWLFFLNVPIGIIGVIAAARLLRDSGVRDHRPFDLPSFVLAAVSLPTLLVALDRAVGWGWGSPRFLGLAGFGAGLLALFVRRQLRVQHPLLDLRMFAVRTFSVTVGIVWLITVAQFARLVFIPLQLQTVHGLTAFETGTVLAPAAISTAIMMPIGGRLADLISIRVPIAVGTGIILVGTWLLAHLTPTTPLPLITVFLAVQGLGTGLSLMPNTVAAMNSLPTRLVAQASAVRNLNRQLAGAFGVAVLASVVTAQIGGLGRGAATSTAQLQDAYNSVFLIAFGVALFALVLSYFLPDREQTRAMQQERFDDAPTLAFE